LLAFVKDGKKGEDVIRKGTFCSNDIAAKIRTSVLKDRVTRLPVFNGIVPFLREVSRFPTRKKTGRQIVSFFNSAVFL
jgi:hypothetical protein